MIARRGSIDPGDCTRTVSLFLSTSLSLYLSLFVPFSLPLAPRPCLSRFGIYTLAPSPLSPFLRGHSISLPFSFSPAGGASHPCTGWRAGCRVQGHACTPFGSVGSFLPSFLPFRGESLLPSGSKSKNPGGDPSLTPIQGKRSPTSSTTTAGDQRHFRWPTYIPDGDATPFRLDRINPDSLRHRVTNLFSPLIHLTPSTGDAWTFAMWESCDLDTIIAESCIGFE